MFGTDRPVAGYHPFGGWLGRRRCGPVRQRGCRWGGKRRSRNAMPIRGRCCSPRSPNVSPGTMRAALQLTRRISNALMTRFYRERPGEWDLHDEMAASEVADVLPGSLEVKPGGHPRPILRSCASSTSRPRAGRRWRRVREGVARRTASSTSLSSSAPSRMLSARRRSIPILLRPSWPKPLAA